MQNTTNINITGNNNTVIVGQSNESGSVGCSFSGCGCLIVIFILFLISFVSIISANVKYKPTDNQKWFEPVHGSHSNQINYRKSCQLCKDELCDDILKEHMKPKQDIHWGNFITKEKEKCPICKFNLKLSKTEIKKIYSESQKSIQYVPIFFEEYPMIDNDIIPCGCRSIKWIQKQKAMTVKI